jgi:hypothetical protein
MVPDNSGPQDCCCDKEYDYLVIEEYVGGYLYTGGQVDSFCGGPKEWEHTVFHIRIGRNSDDNITAQVNKQQDSIEVTFTLSNAISGQEDPCYLFRPSVVTPPGGGHNYKMCNFSASFEAKKLFPVNPFPWLRPEKRARVTVKISHKRLGGFFRETDVPSEFKGLASGGASITLTPCWATDKAKALFSQYPDCTIQECTYNVPSYPDDYPDPTITLFITKCLDGDLELNETVYLPNSHVGVYVFCNYYSKNAFCFPYSVKTKFTISVEEVDP